MRKISNLWTKGAFAGPTHFRLAVAGLVLVAGLALPAHAQNDRMTPIATPSQPNAIVLGTGPLPGATNPEVWHSHYGSQFARNVTIATLTPFLPDPAKASGAAVIVAPGGGFFSLSMENEGSNVARALAEKGVAAFVLKYRLNQTPADMPGFEKSMREMFSGTARPPRPDPEKAIAGLAPQIADARAAFALIRKRSAEWHVDPNRIGMIRVFRRRDADYGNHACRRGCEARLHRQHLRSSRVGHGAGRCAATVHCPGCRRPFFREQRLRAHR